MIWGYFFVIRSDFTNADVSSICAFTAGINWDQVPSDVPICARFAQSPDSLICNLTNTTQISARSDRAGQRRICIYMISTLGPSRCSLFDFLIDFGVIQFLKAVHPPD